MELKPHFFAWVTVPPLFAPLSVLISIEFSIFTVKLSKTANVAYFVLSMHHLQYLLMNQYCWRPWVYMSRKQKLWKWKYLETMLVELVATRQVWKTPIDILTKKLYSYTGQSSPCFNNGYVMQHWTLQWFECKIRM